MSADEARWHEAGTVAATMLLQAKIVAVVTLASMAGLCLASPWLWRPYLRVPGELILVLVAVVYAAAWRLGRRAALAAGWRYVEGTPQPTLAVAAPALLAFAGLALFLGYPLLLTAMSW